MIPEEWPSEAEIKETYRRTAAENGGVPLDQKPFADKTGYDPAFWTGRYWSNFNKLRAAAGFELNPGSPAYDPDLLKSLLAEHTRKHNKFPTNAELKVERARDRNFPSPIAFTRHVGPNRNNSKADRIAAVLRFCQSHQEYADVLPILAAELEALRKSPTDATAGRTTQVRDGDVYLLKWGGSGRRLFKIGYSIDSKRRQRQLKIQLPERPNQVHSFKTDDPAGIEGYWHKRFADKRKNGEWFQLTPDDVAAFKRRKKFM